MLVTLFLMKPSPHTQKKRRRRLLPNAWKTDQSEQLVDKGAFLTKGASPQ